MNPAESRLLELISLDEPWSLVEEFSRTPREQPADANAAADSLIARLERLGLPVTVYNPQLFLSLPGPSSVTAGGTEFRAKAPSMSAIAPDGVTAPLVYVPAHAGGGIFDTVDRAAAAAIDVKGKIVITEGLAMPGNVAEFEKRGAAALIAINPGQDIHWGTCTSIWGVPGLNDLERKPRIPAVAVNNPDGQKLLELAQAGAEATVVTSLEEGWFESRLPVVEIRGNEEPEKFVLLHGHYDSWDVGVGDNATGDATLLEVARVIQEMRGELKRSVRIAWWPGHSTGRYAGSTWYADEFAIDLEENCVAQINCDSPGCRWATEYKDVSLTAETGDFAAGIIRDAVGQPLRSERAHQAGDYSFNNLGISGFFMLLSTMPDDLRAEKGYYQVGGCGANIAWHTENDTLEIADRDILLKDMKIYALAAFRTATIDYLPFDWRITTRLFAQRLGQYQEAAGGTFDVGPANEALQALDDALAEFARRRDSLDPRVANGVTTGLARILIPVDYTRGPRFSHEPAFTVPSLPDLAPTLELPALPEEKVGFAVAQLTRGRNRVVAALRRATAVVNAALA